MFLYMLTVSCGNHSTVSQTDGTIEIFVFLHQPDGLAKTALPASCHTISWNKLVIEITASDIDTIYDTISLSETNVDTAIGIPPGDDRKITVWTEDDSNRLIHRPEVYMTDVDPGQRVSAAFELYPAAGSIYIQLARIPSDIDSVFAVFKWEDDSAYVARSRKGMLFLTIDYVPDNVEGDLLLWATDASGVMRYADTLSIHFHAHANSSYEAQFTTAAGSSINLDIRYDIPGITVITGAIDAQSPGNETGPLMITEIMYSGDNDSDYIEFRNSSATDFQTDILILEIQGTSSSTSKRLELADFTLPAGQFYVISHCGSEFIPSDTCIPGMSLPKSGGRTIVIKDAEGNTHDYVSYTMNDQGWPQNINYTSVVFEPEGSDVEENNYGSNWEYAQSIIEGTSHKGTPGAGGR